jgi:cytochrome oxidase Cu insertion factor (SCO1/SenC/PrrC family)
MCGEYVKREGLRYTFGSLFDPFVGFPFLDHTMPKSSRSARTAGIVVLAFLVLAAAAAYIWWRQLPGRMEDGCSLHERRCSTAVPGGGRVMLGIEPRPLAYGQPWKLTVSFEETTADTIEVDFTGLTAPTSYNRAALAAAKDGGFEGEATLPWCSFEPMDWQATLLLGTGDQRRTVPFVLSTDPAARPTSEPRKVLANAPGGGMAMLRGAEGPFSGEQMRGYATVLFFGYTRTPSTCPRPLTVIDGALAKLSADERARVRAVMITLDTEGDAPERLQPELQAKHGPAYRIVTGADADLIGAARLYGGAFVRRLPAPDGTPRIDHSTIYSIVDPTGRLVGQLAAQDPDRLATELRKALGTGAAMPISAAR